MKIALSPQNDLARSLVKKWQLGFSFPPSSLDPEFE